MVSLTVFSRVLRRSSKDAALPAMKGNVRLASPSWAIRAASAKVFVAVAIWSLTDAKTAPAAASCPLAIPACAPHGHFRNHGVGGLL